MSPGRGYKQSEEHRHKISESLKGKKRKPLTEEHKRNISESLKGRKFSDAHKRNLSESKKDKKHSEEARRKQSYDLSIPKLITLRDATTAIRKLLKLHAEGLSEILDLFEAQMNTGVRLAQMNIGIRYLRLMDRIFSKGHKRKLSEAKKSKSRTELTDEMIGLMCVQTKYFSGRIYRSRIEIIMLAYNSIFRRRREEAKLHDR